MTELCRAVLDEKGKAGDAAEEIAIGINALIDGLWSSMGPRRNSGTRKD